MAHPLPSLSVVQAPKKSFHFIHSGSPGESSWCELAIRSTSSGCVHLNWAGWRIFLPLETQEVLHWGPAWGFLSPKHHGIVVAADRPYAVAAKQASGARAASRPLRGRRAAAGVRDPESGGRRSARRGRPRPCAPPPGSPPGLAGAQQVTQSLRLPAPRAAGASPARPGPGGQARSRAACRAAAPRAPVLPALRSPRSRAPRPCSRRSCHVPACKLLAANKRLGRRGRPSSLPLAGLAGGPPPLSALRPARPPPCAGAKGRRGRSPAGREGGDGGGRGGSWRPGAEGGASARRSPRLPKPSRPGVRTRGRAQPPEGDGQEGEGPAPRAP